MEREDFERLVEEALMEIPEEFIELFENISIQIQDRAPLDTYRKTGTPESNEILGLYHGVPFKHMGPYYGNTTPNIIVLYQKTIERVCRDEEEIKNKIREVLIHEVGHYFGFNDAQLRQIEKLKSEY